MSGGMSCFYRLFVARLQVFPFFSSWFVEREVRNESKTEREEEFSFIAPEQEVQSDTLLLGLQGTAPVNRLFFLKQAAIDNGRQIFIINIKVIAKCFFCVYELIRLSLNFSFFTIT